MRSRVMARIMDTQRYVEQWVRFVSLTFSWWNICINFSFSVYITRTFISDIRDYRIMTFVIRKIYVPRKETAVSLFEFDQIQNNFLRKEIINKIVTSYYQNRSILPRNSSTSNISFLLSFFRLLRFRILDTDYYCTISIFLKKRNN